MARTEHSSQRLHRLIYTSPSHLPTRLLTDCTQVKPMLKHLIEMAKESQKEEHTLEAAVKKDRSALEKRLKALQKEEEEADLNSTGEAQRIYEDWRREVSVHA